MSTCDSPSLQLGRLNGADARHREASPWRSKPSGRVERLSNRQRLVPSCDRVSSVPSRLRDSRRPPGSPRCFERWQALHPFSFERNR